MHIDVQSWMQIVCVQQHMALHTCGFKQAPSYIHIQLCTAIYIHGWLYAAAVSPGWGNVLAMCFVCTKAPVHMSPSSSYEQLGQKVTLLLLGAILGRHRSRFTKVRQAVHFVGAVAPELSK